jgi:Restriction endonuclease
MISPPVDPRPENLPLNDPNWSWDRFEAFCRDLISQFDTTEIANPYGRKGDSQKGIDIVARLTDGTCWVFQCKRYKQFTEADVKKAIEKATYEANRYILLLSCEASAKVIDEINNHSNWECWDVRNISARVRELDKDISRRLVEDHFGTAWRRAFLGLSGLETFVSSKTFFQTLLDQERLFHHCWLFVGRKSIYRF